ncbi:MAG: hypothetical protein J7M08_09390 [Planctomycetes bacterium]|nr:hypothetical protein [Planctomycetota bacterium]
MPLKPACPPFALFGMGRRRKLLYQDGALRDALTGETLSAWPVVSQKLEPAEYRVTIETRTGELIRIVEDEEGVWVEAAGDRTPLTRSPVKLPRFEKHPQQAFLRAFHGELLVNVMPFGPVPNLWVYPRPWYRDAAMMLMCFQKTGNLALVEPWIAGLHKVWDRNNGCEREPDNLGQALYMISLVSDRRHPLVEKILKEIDGCRRGRHIVGRTDGAEHPVYQTKWLKYGLRALGLEDDFEAPAVFDSYGAAFWMDFKEQHVDGPRFGPRMAQLGPYLTWAEAHFHGDDPPIEIGELKTPLTWERDTSEAEYWRMSILSSELVESRVCTPHAWHAAEMFLYFLDGPGSNRPV